MTIDEAIAEAVAAGKRKDLPRAVEILQQVIALDPHNGLAWANLGNALALMERSDESIAALEKAIAISPQNPRPYRVLGTQMLLRGDIDEAVKLHSRAVEVSPDDAESHGLLAHTLLLAGDLARGLAEYEWRWKCGNFDDRQRMQGFRQPQWRGEDIAGKRILVHFEQGLGDTIQFVRYAPLLVVRGATVIVQAQRELANLVGDMPSVSQFVRPDESPPEFDVHVPMMSLPLAFGTIVESIPANVPYLSPREDAVNTWREKLAEDASRLKVGLA